MNQKCGKYGAIMGDVHSGFDTKNLSLSIHVLC